MAYKAILNNDILFFDSSLGDDSFLLTEAVINMEAGAAGEFIFTLPPENEYYDSFHRIVDYIDVYRDDELVFSGRVYSIEQLFNSQKRITCEGLLAVLADSIYRPETFQGTLHDLVRRIISSHNAQVDGFKLVATNLITVPNTNVYREYINHETSISRLQDLVSSFGGYMRITKRYNPHQNAIADIAVADIAVVDNYAGSTLVFTWEEDFTLGCTQKIELGENLLDITQEETADNIITVLIPIGATDDEGNKLTIESVNDGKDYLVADPEYLREYGYIVGTHTWDDVNIAANLKTKGEDYLNACLVPKKIINLNAVDLADAGYEVDSFRIGQKVTVNSPVHGIDNMRFACISQRLDLLHPSENRLELGEVVMGYVQAQRANSLSSLIDKMSHSFASKSVLQIAIENATELITGNQGGFVVFKDSNNDGRPDEILIMDTPDIDTAVRVWRFNNSGLGFSASGYYGQYETAITMDGGIVGSFITAMSVTADKIDIADLFAQNITATNFTLAGGRIDMNTTASTDDRIRLTYGNKIAHLAPNYLMLVDNDTHRQMEFGGGGLNGIDLSTNKKVVGAGINETSGYGSVQVGNPTDGPNGLLSGEGDGYLALGKEDNDNPHIFLDGQSGRILAMSVAGNQGYVPIRRQKFVSGTTNSNGLISTGLTMNNGQHVIGAYMSQNQNAYLVYPVLAYNSGSGMIGTWYIACETYSGTRVSSGTSVALAVVYLEI